MKISKNDDCSSRVLIVNCLYNFRKQTLLPKISSSTWKSILLRLNLKSTKQEKSMSDAHTFTFSGIEIPWLQTHSIAMPATHYTKILNRYLYAYVYMVAYILCIYKDIYTRSTPFQLDKYITWIQYDILFYYNKHL